MTRNFELTGAKRTGRCKPAVRRLSPPDHAYGASPQLRGHHGARGEHAGGGSPNHVPEVLAHGRESPLGSIDARLKRRPD